MSMISDMIEWMKTIQVAELYSLKRFDQTYQKKKEKNLRRFHKVITNRSKA